MRQNALLYNASMALVKAAEFVKPLDPEYALELLDKAEEYKNKIVVDDELGKEVEYFEQEIRKRL